MDFKVIEQNVLGKDNSLKNCEDKIVINDNFVCVIDGATSKSDILFQGKTQGKIASEHIEVVLNKTPYNISVKSFIEEVNKEFNIFYKSVELEKHMIKNPLEQIKCINCII